MANATTNTQPNKILTHFSAKNVFATSKEHPSQKVKVPNICFETKDP